MISCLGRFLVLKVVFGKAKSLRSLLCIFWVKGVLQAVLPVSTDSLEGKILILGPSSLEIVLYSFMLVVYLWKLSVRVSSQSLLKLGFLPPAFL